MSKVKVCMYNNICECNCTFISFCIFIFFLRANLCVVKELGDKAAQGRTYGNLGNTYYLLGDFETAVAAHEKVGGKYVVTVQNITSVLVACQLSKWLSSLCF